MAPTAPTIVVVLGLVAAPGAGWGQTQFSSARGAVSASAQLRNVLTQIRRYDCHKPEFAHSVEGCRRLHARARALSRRPAPRRSRAPAPAKRDGRSFFARLFGGPGPSRARRATTRGAVGSTGPFSSWFNGPGYGARRERTPRQRGKYRTLCVRMCDGYYWPMSFATGRHRFAADAARCRNSCDSPARLFVYANPGGSVEHMYDLEGSAYASLDNAFRYRTEFLPSCRCKPEPWTEAAQDVYEERALAVADRLQETESAEASRNADTER